MIRIKSKARSFILNGKEFQKGTLTVSHDADGVAINGIYAKLEDIECDGVSFTTKAELETWISDNLFYNGGGTGEGVQQQELASVSGSAWSFGVSGYYSYTGTGITKPLPNPGAGQTYFIKNRGTGILIITGNIYLTTTVTSIELAPGEAIILHDDGDFWTAQ